MTETATTSAVAKESHAMGKTDPILEFVRQEVERLSPTREISESVSGRDRRPADQVPNPGGGCSGGRPPRRATVDPAAGRAPFDVPPLELSKRAGLRQRSVALDSVPSPPPVLPAVNGMARLGVAAPTFDIVHRARFPEGARERQILLNAIRNAASAPNPHPDVYGDISHRPVPRWPTDPDGVNQLLTTYEAKQLPAADTITIVCTGTVPKREDRAYVPTAQGNGLRYNWDVTHDRNLYDLYAQIEARRAEGWRICSLATPGNLASPGYKLDELSVELDAVWTIDDDSNFRWGLRDFAASAFDAEMASLRHAGARPLCLVNIGTDKELRYCVVWIQDRKYEGADAWRADRFTFPIQTGLQPHLDDGFRPIWISSWMGHAACVLVKDTWTPNFAILPHTYFDPSFDVVAAFRELHPTLFPICVEIKAWPTGIETLYNSFVLGVDYPDIVEEDLDWTSIVEGKFPDWTMVDDLKWNKFRIPIVVSIPTADANKSNTLHVRVDSSLWRPRVVGCALLDEGTNPPVPITQDVIDEIDSFTSLFMQDFGIPALSLAILDENVGWRVRRAYTVGPREYETTYPDSQFRAASLSKPITSFSIWTMVANHNLEPDQSIWELLPDLYKPTFPYPLTANDVRVEHLLRHTAGWTDRSGYFDVINGSAPKKILAAAGISSVPMAGWGTGKRGLWPLVRDDVYHYQFVSDVFTLNPDYVAAAGAPPGTITSLRTVTGWRGFLNSFPAQPPYQPGDTSSYSNFGYGVLGRIIEEQAGMVSGPKGDYSGYVKWVKANLLAQLGMTSTVEGYSARVRAHPGEVICTGTMDYKYLPPGSGIFTGKPVSPFKPTRLYDVDDEALSTYSQLGYPPDYYDSPEFVSKAHGNDYRLENAMPSTGWLMTASDACRLFRTLVEGEGGPLDGNFWLSILRSTNESKADLQIAGAGSYNIAGLVVGQAVGGAIYLAHGGFLPPGICEARLYLPTNRRIAMFHNHDAGSGGAYVAGIESILDDFGI